MPEPMRDELYPDVTADGGLVEALQQLAARRGLNLGSITPELGGVQLVLADRQAMLFLDSEQRSFIAEFWGKGVRLAQGATADLDMMAGAIHDWGQGLSLFDLPSRHPFMEVSEVAMAHERGDIVEVMWQALLENHGDDMRLIAEAAVAEPRLRELFPYTSHRFLCFSRCTVYPYSMDLPMVVPLGGGRYRALRRDGSILVDGSPAEAAAAVVTALPDDCGPAIAGTLGR